jgi:hypothetical protein
LYQCSMCPIFFFCCNVFSLFWYIFCHPSARHILVKESVSLPRCSVSK